ncbi:AraC family transcriptional regulator [Kribbella capetownensis]|uniref:AraC family transcriptional regulator n=1 Tax=Kribbella capetownensis TaxID=1572659 RepID=A0A4V6N4K9_9ACTN|nr:helix-turn-helix transcriptional regulator [Kribbella capetownensis]TCC50672.1 AraC family transcriptional regulator [Kribbella capetownensis]
MTVSADSAKDRVRAATTGLVELRENGRWVGGSHLYDGGEQLITGWHFHDVHEIEYACRGVVEVETEAGHYLLPPHQAAWIPAGLHHRTTLNAGAQILAVLFEPNLVPRAGDRVRIIAVSTLLREMMLHSARWPISRAESGVEANSFFQTLGYLVAEALDDEMPLNLPVSTDPLVIAATDYTRDHLDQVAISDVTRAVGVSERTLRRIFSTHLSMSWRSYLLRARVLRAMGLLAQPHCSILDVAIAVGFDDVGAFARSFARHCGETPSAYKRRIIKRGQKLR